jgi:YVTN family beta-propeller protein
MWWAGLATVAVCVVLLGAQGAAVAAPAHNASVIIGKATPFKVASGPNRMAYNPVNHDLYVPAETANEVQIYNSTNVRVATVHLPADSGPGAAAFDPSNNEVYVTGESSNAVYVLTGTKLTTTITSATFDDPYGIIYDPGLGAMLVANDLGTTITWFIGNTVGGTIPVGSEPFEIAYDQYWNNVLVTNYGSANVTVLNALYLSYVTSIPVGAGPTGIAYDPQDLRDYVANFDSGNVSVLKGSGSVVATISGLSYPDGVTFSQKDLEMYVTCAGSGKVYSYLGVTLKAKYSTAAGSNPVDATYDPYNDNVYVSGYDDARVFVVP